MVLDTDETAVAVALTEVGALIPAIQAAVSRSGDEEQLELMDTYALHWSIPITTPDWRTGDKPSPGKGVVHAGALAALGGLSSFLSSTRSEGAVPDDENRQRLIDLVRDAIDELAKDEDLPPDVRWLVRERLGDILWALDKIRFRGPDAARAATERLAFVMLTAPEEVRARPSMKRAVAAAGAVWRAILSGPAVQPGIAAWSDMAGSLISRLGG